MQRAAGHVARGYQVEFRRRGAHNDGRRAARHRRGARRVAAGNLQGDQRGV